MNLPRGSRGNIPPVSTTVIEREFKSANDLWEALSPTRRLFREPSRAIFRGHASASWDLVPSVLRGEHRMQADQDVLPGADGQVFYEVRLLEEYAEYCDRVGVRIPGDSISFRSKVLNSQNIDEYLINPSRWPNVELFEVMAFAQHHGVPTRLLDWTRNPYAAIYFAVETALKTIDRWSVDDRMAIWFLNIETIALYQDRVQLVKPPGSVSPHLAAQSGLFTVQRLLAQRGSNLEIRSLDEVIAGRSGSDLLKFTVPVTESVRLLHLCERIGINAATLFPGPDGAARAVLDAARSWNARQWLINRGLWSESTEVTEDRPS